VSRRCQGVLRSIRGCSGCILCQKRLGLSSELDECKPLIAGSEAWPLGLPIGDALMGAAVGLLTASSTAGLAPFVCAPRRVWRRALLAAAATWVAGAYTRPLFGST